LGLGLGLGLGVGLGLGLGLCLGLIVEREHGVVLQLDPLERRQEGLQDVATAPPG
jgi:hypothetical protein